MPLPAIQEDLLDLIKSDTDTRRPSWSLMRPITHTLAEVWRFRYLLQGIVLRDLKIKYQRSSLGFIWTFINPLLTVGILVAVFRIVIRIQIENYWAFLLSGYFVWNMIQQTLMTGSHIFYQYAQLSKNVAFPKEIVLFGAACARLIEFCAEMAMIIVFLVLVHHHALPLSYLLLPIVLLIHFLMVMGIMFPIVALSMFFHDVQHALPIMITSLFYLTPVFYPAEMVPEAIRPFYFINPFAGALTLYQELLYHGRLPSLALICGTAAAAMVLFIFGYYIFKRYESIYNELV